jgi:hypothetical protein
MVGAVQNCGAVYGEWRLGRKSRNSHSEEPNLGNGPGNQTAHARGGSI